MLLLLRRRLEALSAWLLQRLTVLRLRLALLLLCMPCTFTLLLLLHPSLKFTAKFTVTLVCEVHDRRVP
jgi:hypothetical protein